MRLGTRAARTIPAAVAAVLAGTVGLEAQAPAADDTAATDTVQEAPTRAAPDGAADGGDVSSPLRATLRQRMASLRQRWEASSSPKERERLSREINSIRQRLMMGDFAPGELVKLEVRKMPRWSGEFTVGQGRTLKLEGIEPISLKGALRPEGEARVEEALSAYIRDPEVEFESLRRIGVLGAVTNPGFYQFSGDVTVSEAIMRAGGLTQEAEMEDFKVESEGKKLAGGASLDFQERTLDELGLRSGDALTIPTQGEGARSWLVAAGSLGSVLGVALAIF